MSGPDSGKGGARPAEGDLAQPALAARQPPDRRVAQLEQRVLADARHAGSALSRGGSQNDPAPGGKDVSGELRQLSSRAASTGERRRARGSTSCSARRSRPRAEFRSQRGNQNNVETRQDSYRFPDLQVDYGRIAIRAPAQQAAPESAAAHLVQQHDHQRTTTPAASRAPRARAAGSRCSASRASSRNGTRTNLAIERRVTTRDIFQLGQSTQTERVTDANFGLNRSYQAGQKVAFFEQVDDRPQQRQHRVLIVLRGSRPARPSSTATTTRLASRSRTTGSRRASTAPTGSATTSPATSPGFRTGSRPPARDHEPQDHGRARGEIQLLMGARGCVLLLALLILAPWRLRRALRRRRIARARARAPAGRDGAADSRRARPRGDDRVAQPGALEARRPGREAVGPTRRTGRPLALTRPRIGRFGPERGRADPPVRALGHAALVRSGPGQLAPEPHRCRAPTTRRIRVAVLLEVAELMQRRAPRVTVDLVFLRRRGPGPP